MIRHASGDACYITSRPPISNKLLLARVSDACFITMRLRRAIKADNSIATPRSVNAIGAFLDPRRFEVANSDIKLKDHPILSLIVENGKGN